jgi:2'-5' RNA ligase
MSESMRAFICIDVPDSIRSRAGDLQRRLQSIGADVSWVKPSNLHLTLKFLGHVSPERLNEARAALERAVRSASRFEIEVGGTGCFPSARSPRVLWIGLGAVPDQLLRLHDAIESEMEAIGFQREPKPFTPHLTIGRLRSGRNAARLAQELLAAGFEPERFTARQVILMRSDLRPAGAIYTPQAAMPLPEA